MPFLPFFTGWVKHRPSFCARGSDDTYGRGKMLKGEKGLPGGSIRAGEKTEEHFKDDEVEIENG